MKKIFTILLTVFIIQGILAQTPGGTALEISFEQFELDGIVRWVDCGNDASFNLSNEATFEVWVKIHDSGWNQKIMGKTNLSFNSGYVVGLENGKCYAEIWNPSLNEQKEGFILPQQYWVHMAVTFVQGGMMTTYINGVNEGSIAVSANPISSNSDDFIIGIAPWDLANFQTFGQLDEIRVWNVALTEEQIKANIFLELDGSESGLVAYYSFNDGTGSTLSDLSPNANDGTMMSMSEDNWVESTAVIGDETMAGQQDLNGLWRGNAISNPRLAITENGLSMAADFEEGDNHYIVFGMDGNNGITTADIAGDAPAAFERLDRIWYLNVVDSVLPNLTFDLDDAADGGSLLAIDKDPTYYTLLGRDATSGEFAAVAKADIKTDNKITFNEVAVQSQYYTLGVGDAEYDVSTTGISEPGYSDWIKSYPNPVSQVLYITLDPSISGQLDVEIRDLSGRILQSKHLNFAQDLELDISMLTAGQYLLRIKGDDQQLYRQFIVY